MDFKVIKDGKCECRFGLINGGREETSRSELEWFTGSCGTAAVDNLCIVNTICADYNSWVASQRKRSIWTTSGIMTQTNDHSEVTKTFAHKVGPGPLLNMM